MKALMSIQSGADLSLMDVPAPKPASGEALIRVRACGVNYPDVLMVRDAYQFKPDRPFAPGSEVAGEVAELGSGVTELRVGDRVIASTGVGGMAECVLAPVERCLQMPDVMPFDEGAALFTTFGTAFFALQNCGQLKAAETLLVLGAGGGVGLAAVQLGRAFGARVIAAASSEEKLALARHYGAELCVKYPREGLDTDQQRAFSASLKNACGADGADVIFDGVGGDYAEAALRASAWAGRYLIIGFTAGIPKIPLNLPLLKGCSLTGVFYGAWVKKNMAADRENRHTLLSLYQAGKIRPHIGRRYALKDGAQALTDLAERRALGKIVVTL